jgi:hypothetical protein
MLETADHQITFVFESLLTAGTPRPAIMSFAFSWPDGLVDAATGACSGLVRMTLVYEPPLDPAFGPEFARVNLDASLKQRQTKWTSLRHVVRQNENSPEGALGRGSREPSPRLDVAGGGRQRCINHSRRERYQP